jgi:hypothetical protein
MPIILRFHENLSQPTEKTYNYISSGAAAINAATGTDKCKHLKKSYNQGVYLVFCHIR